MREVLKEIFTLFFLANPESPYGLDRGDEFRFNRAVYKEKAKYFTDKYVNPSKPQAEYNTDWDSPIPQKNFNLKIYSKFKIFKKNKKDKIIKLRNNFCCKINLRFF